MHSVQKKYNFDYITQSPLPGKKDTFNPTHAFVHTCAPCKIFHNLNHSNLIIIFEIYLTGSVMLSLQHPAPHHLCTSTLPSSSLELHVWHPFWLAGLLTPKLSPSPRTWRSLNFKFLRPSVQPRSCHMGMQISFSLAVLGLFRIT